MLLHRSRTGARRDAQAVAVQEAEGKTLVTSYGGIWWTSGSRPVAHLWGELDAANAAGVFAIIRQGVERHEVVIDLSDVVFMGSNVLGELLTLTKDAAVRVVAPQGGQPRRVLELTGLTATISTFDTVAAALDAH